MSDTIEMTDAEKEVAKTLEGFGEQIEALSKSNKEMHEVLRSKDASKETLEKIEVAMKGNTEAIEAIEASQKDMEAKVKAVSDGQGLPGSKSGNGKEGTKHWAELALETKSFKEYVESRKGSGVHSVETKAQIDAAGFGAAVFGQKAAAPASFQPGDAGFVDLKPVTRSLGPREPVFWNIMDFLRVVPVDSASIQVFYDVWTNNIPPTAEKWDRSTGDPKPVRTLVGRTETATADWIADGLKIPVDCLDDIPGLQDRLNVDLVDSLKNGITKDAFAKIIANVANLSTIVQADINGTRLNDAVVAAATSTLNNRRPYPTKGVTNPSTWGRLVTEKTVDGNEYLLDSVSSETPSIFHAGVRIFASPDAAEHSLMTFAPGAALIRPYKGARIKFMDQNEDDARQNLTYMRGEVRYIFEWRFPQSIAYNATVLTPPA